MRVHRIVLLIFAFAFLAQGKSLPSTFSEEANIPTALPIVSINDGYQGIAEDFNDDSLENILEAPLQTPPISQARTQSNADKADGLKELSKEFKHGRLNLKHLSKKLAPLLKTRDVQHTASDILVGKQASGSMEKVLPTKPSQQPKKSKNLKQNPPKKSKQERPSLDEEVRPKNIRKGKTIRSVWDQSDSSSEHTDEWGLLRSKSGKGQSPDPESITNWASNEHEYEASGSGEQKEMEQPDNYDDWGTDATEEFNSKSEFGPYLKSARLRHRKTEGEVQWGYVASRDTQQHTKTDMESMGAGKPQYVEPDSYVERHSGAPPDAEQGTKRGTEQGTERDTKADLGTVEPRYLDTERYVERDSGAPLDTEEGAEQGTEQDTEADVRSGGLRYLEPERYIERDSSAHLDTEKGTEQGNEAGVGSGGPRYLEPERFLERKYRVPVDTEHDTEADLGSEEPQYIEPYHYIERGSGAHLDTEQGTESDVRSGEPRYLEPERFIEKDSGALVDTEQGTEQGTEQDTEGAVGSVEPRYLEPKRFIERDSEVRLVILPSKGKIAAPHGPDGVSHGGAHSGKAPKPLTIPRSDFRWTGLSQAHRKSHDEIIGAGKRNDKKEEQKGGGLFIIAVTCVAAGVFLFLLVISFFAFAWPIRKYYECLYTSIRNGDVESGGSDGEELTSVRVDSSYPPEDYFQGGYYYYYYPQEEHLPSLYQTPETAEYLVTSTSDNMSTVAPHGTEVPLETEVSQRTNVSPVTLIRDKVRMAKDVIKDDKKRDSRNAERRRIIKRHTSDRRNSLLDSLTIAKSLIDGQSKNKEYEKKASERRRVIKRRESELVSTRNKRQVHFADDIQTACSVIVPKWDHKESLKKSKEKCRKIKDQFSGKRRPSLTEEIEVAKEIIVDSERRKYEIPAAVVEEMIQAYRAPGGAVKYYSDALRKLIEENREMEERIKLLREERSKTAEKEKFMLENEILWGEESF